MPTQPQDGADRRTQLAADGTVFAAERTYPAWARTASPRWPAV
jgi:putative membrane protein